jgi:hypothetical protein
MATGRVGNMGAKPQGKNGFAFAQSGFSRSSSGDPITPLSQAETNLEKGRIVMRTVKIIGLIVAGMLAISSTALAGGHGGGGHGGGGHGGGGHGGGGHYGWRGGRWYGGPGWGGWYGGGSYDPYARGCLHMFT